MRRDPKFAGGQNDRGLVLLQTGRFPQAEEAFSEAIRLNPNDAEAHYKLALAFRQEGKKGEAQREFDNAFQLAPELKNVPLASGP